MSLKFDFDPVTAVQLPLSERVLDRLGDVLFAVDEILDMIATQRNGPDETSEAVEREVRNVYHRVNELMKRLCD